MSRNLCRTDCQFCHGEVVRDDGPDGQDHPIREAECGGGYYYYDEYKNMLVAHVHCGLCEAKYLAWVDYPHTPRHWTDLGRPFIDLSHRSTFNDEPDRDDMPKYQITREVIIHKSPWPTCPKCGCGITISTEHNDSYCYGCSTYSDGNEEWSPRPLCSRCGRIATARSAHGPENTDPTQACGAPLLDGDGE